MNINEEVREMCLFIFVRPRDTGDVEGKTREWCRGQTAVKIQSASAAPGIATVPRSVVQVPMSDNVPTGSAEVSASASVLPARVHVSSDEDDKEDEESGHDDDEEVVDDVNHAALPKGAVHGNSPGRRSKTSDIWKHVRRIANHDLPDHAMKTDCTHVCIYRLTDADGGEKRYCNKPLKLFRSTKGKESSWSTSAALAHFKKNHEDSSSARQQKAGLVKRQTRLGELMHASGSDLRESYRGRQWLYSSQEPSRAGVYGA